MSFITQNISLIKKVVIRANDDWDRVSDFFDTKRRYDTKHGATRITEWFYICFDLNDWRGDIPYSAWQFVHLNQLPDLQLEFQRAQGRKPEISEFMTFDILWRVGGYVPYIRKGQ